LRNSFTYQIIPLDAQIAANYAANWEFPVSTKGADRERTMARINEANVAAHEARLGKDGKLVDAFLWDDDLTGFGCKATPAGKRAFFVQYRPRGLNIRRVHIGYYPKVTVTRARKEAKQLLGEANAGHDPQAQKREAKRAGMAQKQVEAERKTAGTLKEVIERFLADHAKPTRYWKEKRARLLSGALSGLHDANIRDIGRAQLKAAVDAVKGRSHAVARLLFADLRPLFKWCVEAELIAVNPMTGIKSPKPIAARDRVLEPQEIAAFWRAAGIISWPFQSIYRLLLLTGARRDEVAGMSWGELDLDAEVWTIPTSRLESISKTNPGSGTKNHREHRIPLAPAAVTLLDKAAVLATKEKLGYPVDSDLVFSTTGTTAPSGFSKAKTELDKHMQVILGSRFKAWRIHDLRRTCATGMEDLGIATNIVETALNHVSGAKSGIVGVYQRAEHREAVKRAFAQWERRLLEIVGGDEAPSNVVSLWKAG
jgi:integrase